MGDYSGLSEWPLNVITCILIKRKQWRFNKQKGRK